MKCIAAVLCFSLAGCFWAYPAKAAIFISEIYADPANGLAGDANGDGVRSATGDEFVEIFNPGGDISLLGWTISDAIAIRHTFGDAWLVHNQFTAVFGTTASTGALNLNNTNETITLTDPFGRVVDSYFYGPDGNHDQSLVRFPLEKESQFRLHADIDQADGRLFSPETDVGGSVLVNPSQASATIPEPATLWTLLGATGLFGVFHRKASHFKS